MDEYMALVRFINHEEKSCSESYYADKSEYSRGQANALRTLQRFILSLEGK